MKITRHHLFTYLDYTRVEARELAPYVNELREKIEAEQNATVLADLRRIYNGMGGELLEAIIEDGAIS